MSYPVTFHEKTSLGMQLGNGAGGVIVTSFTAPDNRPGQAELSKQIAITDRITHVNQQSTNGMNYRQVLDLIVSTKERPITIEFERRGNLGDVVERAEHKEWVPKEEPKDSTHTKTEKTADRQPP